MRIFLGFILAISLSGCVGDSFNNPVAMDAPVAAPQTVAENDNGGGEIQASDALEAATSLLNLASAAVGVANATSGGGASMSAANVGRSGAIASSNGYSQLGSFQDCQKMYMAAGMANLAQQCANRAANMGSIR